MARFVDGGGVCGGNAAEGVRPTGVDETDDDGLGKGQCRAKGGEQEDADLFHTGTLYYKQWDEINDSRLFSPTGETPVVPVCLL